MCNIYYYHFVGHSLEKLKTWRENTGVETFKSMASRSHLKLTLVLTWQLQEIWSVLASSAKLNSKMLVRGYLYPAKADFNSIIGRRSVCSLNFSLIQVALAVIWKKKIEARKENGIGFHWCQLSYKADGTDGDLFFSFFLREIRVHADPRVLTAPQGLLVP